MSALTLAQLRRYAVARTLFAPTTLPRAIQRLGFVQADPICAPARAQDLTLRHRVRDYRAGDLGRRYAGLDIEEDFFVNYGYLPRATAALMHPRTPRGPWPAARQRQAAAVLEFVRAYGVVHPRAVDAHFQHGKTVNWFGGQSNASTQLLDAMHHRGLLRIARREGGVRLYAAGDVRAPSMDPASAMDALVDTIAQLYAPLPKASLSGLVTQLRGGMPQWTALRSAALTRALRRLPQANVEGITWVWPDGENPASRRHTAPEQARLLTPFDPLVWDRRRFEIFWGWPYRFEAYTPAPQRQLGYYALPLLWRDAVVGWANVAVRGGQLQPEVGFFGPRLTDPAFSAALDDELHRLHRFLALG